MITQHLPTGLGQTLLMLIRQSPQLRQPLATTSNTLASRDRRATDVRRDRASCTNVPSARYPLRVGTGFSCAKALLVDGVSRQMGGAFGVRLDAFGARLPRA